jgi:hypothetical protein
MVHFYTSGHTLGIGLPHPGMAIQMPDANREQLAST